MDTLNTIHVVFMNHELVYFKKYKINLFLQYKQALKFGDIVVNKKEFHASKQAIALNSVKTNIIVTSDKSKYGDDGSKYFIDCLHDDAEIRPVCIKLPQMSGYIKFFDNGGKNMSFKIEDESVYLKNTLKSGIKLKIH